jgi:hypothetical protein
MARAALETGRETAVTPDKRAAGAGTERASLAAPQPPHRKATMDLSGLAYPARPNRTGLPDPLKAGVEALSGVSLDDVSVHYGSSRPAQLQAHAFALGSDIHVAPGQERHLAHEAWHVVQQKQGRVPITARLGGEAISDDAALEAEANTMGARSLAWIGRPTGALVQRTAAPVVQRNRKPNPYSDATANSGSSTAHHIVPDTLLDASMDRVAADARETLKAGFLPALADLTLKQLFETKELDVKVDNVRINRAFADAEPIATTAFGNLGADDKARIKINGQPYATFETEYGQLKGGAVGDDGVALEADHRAGLLTVFYQWQAGNIFLGASSENRLEPGAKDDFDSDAGFFFDPLHVAALLDIFKDLTALRANLDTPANQALTFAKLQQMAALTNPFGAVTANDNTRWKEVNLAQVQLLAKLEGSNRPDLPVGQATKRVPKALLATNSDQAAHADAQGLLGAMNAATPLPTPVRILAPDVSFVIAQAGAGPVNLSLAGFAGETAVAKAGAAYVIGELVTAAQTVLKNALGIA